MKKILAVSMLFLATTSMAAGPFNYTSGTGVKKAGAKEVSFTATSRMGKETGSYNAQDYYIGGEYGLNNQLQLNVSTGVRSHYISNAMPDYHNLNRNLGFNGGKVGLKYKFNDNVAVYLGTGYGKIFKTTGDRQDEVAIDLKVFLQKKVGKNTLAFNINQEFETRKFKGDSDWGHEYNLELTGGIARPLNNNFKIALETRYHSEYPEYQKREHWALFVGPSLSYSKDKLSWAATVLPQITGRPKSGMGSRHLMEHEKLELRFKVSYEL